VIPAPSPNEANDSAYVKMMVNFDTSFPSGLDTADVYQFFYDSQKRLIEVRSFFYEPGIIGGTLGYYEKRFYNGNDTLPYKLAQFWKDVFTNDQIDTVFLTYQNGVIVKDSVKFYSGSQPYETIVNRYKALSGGRVSVSSHNWQNLGIDFSDSAISYQTWVNGNLTTQKDTSFLPSSWTNEFSWQYDNHPNPFYRIALPYLTTNAQLYIGDYGDLFMTKTVNNEIAYSETENGTFIGEYRLVSIS
jgi:hypothetical protein